MVSSPQVLRQDRGHPSLAHQGDHQVRPHGQLTTGSKARYRTSQSGSSGRSSGQASWSAHHRFLGQQQGRQVGLRVVRGTSGSSGGPQVRQVGLRVVRWASGSSGGPQGRQVGLRAVRWALGSLGQLQGRQVAGLQGCSVQRFF
jgi:hypothetical protein